MTQRGNMKKNLTSGICKQCKPDTDKKKKGGIQISMFASFSIMVLWNPQISSCFPLEMKESAIFGHSK